jgi:hypothetical protein
MSDFASEMKAMQETLATMREVTARVGALQSDGRLDRLETLGRTVAAFAVPIEADDDTEADAGSMALLRGFDRHGEGLRPYAIGDATQPADVIVASGRSVWIVDKIDRAGKIASVVGGTPEPKGEPVLRWRPATHARRWVGEKQIAGSAYRDPEAALACLAELWGLSKSDTRSFDKPGALFWELTVTRGVRFSRKGLADEADEKTIRAWLVEHDAAAVGPRTEPMPGDVLWRPDASGFSIVLRAAGRSVDALFVNRRSRGPLGEAKGTAQILREQLLGVDTMLWRPA